MSNRGINLYSYLFLIKSKGSKRRDASDLHWKYSDDLWFIKNMRNKFNQNENN